MKGISELLNLFELERLMITEEEIGEEELISLVGGLSKSEDCFINLEEKYFKLNKVFPWRYWKVEGKDFIVDVLDQSNGWYKIKGIEVRRDGIQRDNKEKYSSYPEEESKT